MLTGIHFILTYTCNFECDHCFLYCSPQTKGTFTLNQVEKVFAEVRKIGTIDTICFEGGESFLFFPILLEGIKLASKEGYATAIETNTYWANSVEDAKLWLKPLKEAGLSLLEVSDDVFHHGVESSPTVKYAKTAARDLGIKVNIIRIEHPMDSSKQKQEKGLPVYTGSPKMRGRAADKLTGGLPDRDWQDLRECPFEDLKDPERVHIDAFGNVHLCQGISMGNMWETPLSLLVKDYDPENHPIAGPLMKGGPAQLAITHDAAHQERYVDECHFCTHLCKNLIDKYPIILGPRQVYGLADDIHGYINAR